MCCDFGYFGLRFVGFAVFRFVVLSLCDSSCCCYGLCFVGLVVVCGSGLFGLEVSSVLFVL